MNELAEILWETTIEHFKGAIENQCVAYETDSKYHLKKVYEAKVLKGFFVYYDTDDCRVLEGAYYTGKDKLMFLKMWKWSMKGAKVMRILIHKTNIKMIDFVKKVKFKKIDEDTCFYVFEGKV